MQSLEADAGVAEVFFGVGLPAGVGLGARRARVEHGGDADRRVLAEGLAGAGLGIGADTDDRPGLEDLDVAAERLVARGGELGALLGGELVGGPVRSARLEEQERTVVEDEEPREEGARRPEPIARPAPEA